MGNELKTQSETQFSVEVYVDEYFLLREKTLGSLLEICRVVYQAKQALVKENFKTFVQRVGLQSTGSISKMVSIGKRYLQFKQYEDQLPCEWTTVYRLTQIDEKTLGELVETDVIHPAVTAAELTPYLPAARSSSGKQPTQSLSIIFDKGLDVETKETIRSLLEQLRQCGCKFKRLKAVEELEMAV